MRIFWLCRLFPSQDLWQECGSDLPLAIPKLIKYLNDVKYSFNSYTMDTNSSGSRCGGGKRSENISDETCRKIIETREWTKKELRKLGFSFEDSKANFIFAAHESCPAEKLFQALREHHIYVRYFPGGRTGNHLRITIGTQKGDGSLHEFSRRIS